MQALIAQFEENMGKEEGASKEHESNKQHKHKEEEEEKKEPPRKEDEKEVSMKEIQDDLAELMRYAEDMENKRKLAGVQKQQFDQIQLGLKADISEQNRILRELDTQLRKLEQEQRACPEFDEDA